MRLDTVAPAQAGVQWDKLEPALVPSGYSPV